MECRTRNHCTRRQFAYQLTTLGAATVFGCGTSDRTTPFESAQEPVLEKLQPSLSSPPSKSQIIQLLADLALETDEVTKVRKILIGQSLGMPSTATENWDSLAKPIRAPGDPESMAIPMISLDLGWEDIESELPGGVWDALIEHSLRGGLCMLNMHPRSCFFPELGLYETGDRSADAQQETGRFGLRDLLDASTLPGQRLGELFEQVAGILRRFEAEKIAVLWRPWHECTGHWFWWSPLHPQRQASGRSTESDFIELWKWTHATFSEKFGLKNLIWVYCAASESATMMKADSLYPGDAFVDATAVDWYGDELNVDSIVEQSGYRTLAKLKPPTSFAEFGSLKHDGQWDCDQAVQIVQANCPRAAFVSAWHSWDEAFGRARVAWADNLNGRVLMTRAGRISRSRLLTRWRENEGPK